MPKVSVVIPTTGRKSLKDAVSSALGQEGVEVEVLICQGSIEVDVESLKKEFKHDQIKIIPLGTNQPSNGNSARQNGVENSKGEYIALLDDDDTWIKNKLRLQLDFLHYQGNDWISATSVIAKLPNGDQETWPETPPQSLFRVAEYLFVRRSIQNLHPMLQTSTLLGKASVFRQVPFEPSVYIHQDWDWLIKAQTKGVNIYFLDLPLTIYKVDGLDNAATRSNAEDSHKWIETIKPLIGTREYAEFLAGTLSSRYLKDNNYRLATRVFLKGALTRNLGIRGFVVGILRLVFGPIYSSLKKNTNV